MRTTARWPCLQGMLLALAAVALQAPALARGQQAPEPETATEVPDTRPLPPAGLETITITDERDTTDVQDEAQAITAFTGDDLDRASIVNVDSLLSPAGLVPIGQADGGNPPITRFVWFDAGK